MAIIVQIIIALADSSVEIFGMVKCETFVDYQGT